MILNYQKTNLIHKMLWGGKKRERCLVLFDGPDGHERRQASAVEEAKSQLVTDNTHDQKALPSDDEDATSLRSPLQ